MRGWQISQRLPAVHREEWEDKLLYRVMAGALCTVSRPRFDASDRSLSFTCVSRSIAIVAVVS